VAETGADSADASMMAFFLGTWGSHNCSCFLQELSCDRREDCDWVAGSELSSPAVMKTARVTRITGISALLLELEGILRTWGFEPHQFHGLSICKSISPHKGRTSNFAFRRRFGLSDRSHIFIFHNHDLLIQYQSIKSGFAVPTKSIYSGRHASKRVVEGHAGCNPCFPEKSYGDPQLKEADKNMPRPG